jgi:CheY-like chemotaxis protein
MQKLLIADDDQLISKVYKLALEKSGFLVEAVFDGVAAREKIINNHYDLILLDIMLPKISGFDILTFIKSHPQYNSTPIVSITNLNTDNIKEIAITKGAVKCLIKDSLDPKQLVAEVQGILGI